jgi:hypothetical protein
VAAVVAGAADLCGGPEDCPGFANVAIALAEMDSVGAKPLCKRDAVVDDEGDVCVGANALQRFGETGELVLLDILDAKLERCGESGLERRLQPVGKAVADLLRADQIELARAALARSEGVSELPRDFVRSQAGTFSVEAS